MVTNYNASVFKMIEQLHKAAKAKNTTTSQFAKVPDWAKGLQNTTDLVTAAKRASLEKAIGGANKISPEDFSLLLQNRNLDVMNILAQKPNLTADQLKAMMNFQGAYAGAKKQYEPGQPSIDANKATYPSAKIDDYTLRDLQGDGFHTYGDKKRNVKQTEMQVALTKKLKDAVGSDFVLHLPYDALRMAVQSREHGVTGEDLMHLIGNKPNLHPSIVEAMTRHPDFDAGHETELFNLASPESQIKMLNGARSVSDATIDRAIQSGNPDVMERLSARHLSSVPPQKLMSLYRAGGTATKRHIAEKIGYRYDNLLPYENAIESEIINNGEAPVLAKYLESKASNLRDNEDSTPLQPELRNTAFRRALSLGTIPNYRATRWLGSVTPEEYNHIARSFVGHPDGSNKLVNWLYNNKEDAAKHLSPETIAALEQDTNPETSYGDESKVLQHLSRMNNTSPETLHSIHHKASQMLAGYDKYAANNIITNIASHPNTPQSLVNQMALQPSLPSSLGKGLAQGGNLDRNIWEKLVFGTTDPEVQSAGAVSPHVTSEDISRILQTAPKEVRRHWITSVDGSKLTPEHWDTMKTDRSNINRATVLDREDLPASVLSHFVLNDKSAAVQAKAYRHPQTTSEMLHAAINKQNPHNLVNSFPADTATEDQTNLLHQRLVEDRVTKLAKLNAQHQKGKIAPEDLANKIEKVSDDYHTSMNQLTHFANLGHDTLNELTKTLNNKLAVHRLTGSGKLAPEHWDNLIDRNLVDDNDLAHRGNLSPATWHKVYKQAEASGAFDPNKQYAEPPRSLLLNRTVPDDLLLKIINHGNDDYIDTMLTNRWGEAPSERSKPVMDAIVNHAVNRLDNNDFGDLNMERLAQHPSLDAGHIEKLYDRFVNKSAEHDNWTGRSLLGTANKLITHHATPENVLVQAIRHPDRALQDTAQKQLGMHDPDKVNNAIGGHTVNVHPAVEKLKHFKGLVQEMGNGAPIPKGKLPNKGQGLPNEIFDAQGRVSPQSVDAYIDALPKAKYNVSYTMWNGAQRHDRTAKQRVVQINLTNDHLKALEDQGVLDIFKKLHKASFRSGHPVRTHSLGWARIDESQPGHWHIDEVQSDLGQGTIRQIEKAKEEGQMSAAEADNYTTALKHIIKTLSGPFKNINHAIAASVHQIARQGLHASSGNGQTPHQDYDVAKNPDIKTISYDNVDDQAKQSSMRTHERASMNHLNEYYNGTINKDSFLNSALHHWAVQNKVVGLQELGSEKFKEQFPSGSTDLPVPVPGFMTETYKQYPKEIGYESADKKQTMPNTNAEETEFQVRKLVKSLKKAMDLYKRIKASKE